MIGKSMKFPELFIKWPRRCRSLVIDYALKKKFEIISNLFTKNSKYLISFLPILCFFNFSNQCYNSPRPNF